MKENDGWIINLLAKLILVSNIGYALFIHINYRLKIDPVPSTKTACGVNPLETEGWQYLSLWGSSSQKSKKRNNKHYLNHQAIIE